MTPFELLKRENLQEKDQSHDHKRTLSYFDDLQFLRKKPTAYT